MAVIRAHGKRLWRYGALMTERRTKRLALQELGVAG